MKIQLPYDGAMVEVDFPANTVVLEAPTPALMSQSTIRQRIHSAFATFRGSLAGGKITVVVNDATRRLPTSKVLEILVEIMPVSAVEVLVATGTHRKPTDAEMNTILGGLRGALEDRIFVHDCYDEASLVRIEETSRGTPVTINRKLYEAENVICINSVEPHFFAGFTGGRKSLIPGLAGFETILRNHSHAKYEESKSLNLENNPVHRDLEEAVGLIPRKPIFSIQLVTSRKGDIVEILCGDLKESFDRACATAKRVYTVPIKEKYDVVLAIGEPPLDVNLYQLQKGQEHGAEAVSDGGVLVVAGACSEGVGSQYFVEEADDYPTPASALSDKALSDNGFGMHKLIKTARRLKTMKVWYVTKIDDNTIRKVYYEPKRSLQAALTDALRLMQKNAKVAILRDACFLVPTVD